MDKRRDIVVGHYSDYDEEKRLDLDRANNLKFLTTMRYIQKYLKPGAKILEVGAATKFRCTKSGKAVQFVAGLVNQIQTWHQYNQFFL